MTRRQSNKQWNGGIAVQPAPPRPAPKNFERKNLLEKFSPGFFWDQDGILFVDYLPKGRTIIAEYYSSLLAQLKDILKEKRRRKVTKVVLFLPKISRLNGHLQPRRNWPTLASSVLITHPILRIWPRRTTNCSLD